MSTEYDTLISQIAQITHRGDLAGQMPFFVEAANELITVRLSLVLETPTDSNDANAILQEYPNLYLYASLISAYEFINELDMATHYVDRFNNEVSRYYITATGRTPSPVMGGDYVDGTGSASTPPVTEPPVLIPQGSVTFNTVAEMVATAGIPLGTLVFCVDYATGNNSGVLSFKAVPVGTGVADGGTYIDGIGVQWAQLFTAGIPTAPQYGSTGTDDDAAIDAAAAAQDAFSIPEGQTAAYSESFVTTPEMASTGPGTLITTESGTPYPRGKSFVHINSFPDKTDSINSPTRGFDGDYKTPHTYQHAITGSNTAGTPVYSDDSESEYLTVYEIAGQRWQTYYQSGKNQSPISTGGRTGFFCDSRHFSHAGKGDGWHAQYNSINTAVDSDILMMRGAPSSGLFAGDVTAGVADVILQIQEHNVVDNGNSCTGKALVFNLKRNAADNGKDQHWWLLRGSSTGTEPVDSGLQLAGDWRNGVDLSVAGDIQRAIALKADQSIYFNTTAKQIKGAPGWLTATGYTTGDYVYNAERVYKAASTGTSGGTPPTHSSGTVSDGGVDWTFVVVQDFKGYADTDDGTRIYWDSANDRLNVDIGGTTILEISSTGLHVNGTVTTTP